MNTHAYYQIYPVTILGVVEWHVEGPGAVETIPFRSLDSAKQYASSLNGEATPMQAQYLDKHLGAAWLQ